MHRRQRPARVHRPGPTAPTNARATGTAAGALAVLAVLASTPLLLGAPSASARSTGTTPPPTLPPPTYATVSGEELVEMDDGVLLAATVVRPSLDGSTPAPGRFPVVLTMTPYGRTGLCGGCQPDAFASRGMTAVIVDVRGTGGSGGDLSENFFSPREARDGAALVDHYGAQETSNGRVGMTGGSYLGITQYLTAAQQPEHLAAITPMVGISDLYRDGFTHGGVVNLLFDLQYIAVQGAPGYAGVNTDPFLLEQTVAAKLGQSPPGSIAFDYLARPHDGPFYRDRSPIEVADRIEVPVLNIGAWQDGLLRGQIEMFTALARRPGIETRLFVDPCTHKGCGPPFAPLTDPPGRQDPLAMSFEFLARYLLDEPTPDRPAVEFAVQPGDRYVSADSWPPAGVRFEELPLLTDGALGPARPADATGRSTPADGAEAGPAPAGEDASYVTNPAAGFSATFSRFGTVGITPFVPLDQRLEGPQGLTFRTSVLEEAVTVAGPITLHLVAASSATDTDWHAKLIDVAPDGTETLVTEGALRASHRALDPARSTPHRPYHTHRDPEPIEPGRFLPYEVEIWPTAHEFAAGHRLQVRVTSTDLPTHLPGWIRFDPERPEEAQLELHDPAVNTVRLSESYLAVPVLDGALPGTDGGPAGGTSGGSPGGDDPAHEPTPTGPSSPASRSADATGAPLPVTGPSSATGRLLGPAALAGAWVLAAGRRRQATTS